MNKSMLFIALFFIYLGVSANQLVERKTYSYDSLSKKNSNQYNDSNEIYLYRKGLLENRFTSIINRPFLDKVESLSYDVLNEDIRNYNYDSNQFKRNVDYEKQHFTILNKVNAKSLFSQPNCADSLIYYLKQDIYSDNPSYKIYKIVCIMTDTRTQQYFNDNEKKDMLISIKNDFLPYIKLVDVKSPDKTYAIPGSKLSRLLSSPQFTSSYLLRALGNGSGILTWLESYGTNLEYEHNTLFSHTTYPKDSKNQYSDRHIRFVNIDYLEEITETIISNI